MISLRCIGIGINKNVRIKYGQDVIKLRCIVQETYDGFVSIMVCTCAFMPQHERCS